MTERKIPFHILVIDDENFSRQMVIRYLTALGAEFVTPATSGQEARAAMADDPSINLIISDHYMGDDSGIHLLWDLRRGDLPLPHGTRFLMATSSKSSALASVALALDADSFLSKPFSRNDLAVRLYAALVDSPRPIKPALYYDRLAIPSMLAAAERQDPAAPTPPACPTKPLNMVRINTQLGGDLIGPDGHVLLLSGTVLTRHLIDRLRELGITEVPVAAVKT